MSQLSRVVTASSLLAASKGVVAVCRFARNVLLARLLMPEDFGVGATFTLAITFLECATEFSPANKLVQARDGGNADWLGAAHLIVAARGLFISLILFFAAPWIAAQLHVPQAVDCFRILALVTLMRGLDHCDIFRFQRELLVGRLSLVNVLPEVLSLIFAPLFAMWLEDYRAFLGVVLVSAVVKLATSHLVAEFPYRWSFDPAILRSYWSFGWPAVGNGLLIFFGMQGDRFLIAKFLEDLSLLGFYSVAIMLVLVPSTLMSSIHQSVALPLLSKCNDRPAEFLRMISRSAQLMCLAAGSLAMLFVHAGGWIIETIYGQDYLLASQVYPWIGLMCAMRVVRATPSMTALALADTRIPLLSNIARIGFFGAAAVMLSLGYGIEWIPVLGFLGEVAAYSISLWLLSSWHGVDPAGPLRCIALVASVVAATWVGLYVALGWPIASSPLCACVGLMLLLAAALASWSDLRDLVSRLIHRSGPLPQKY